MKPVVATFEAVPAGAPGEALIANLTPNSVVLRTEASLAFGDAIELEFHDVFVRGVVAFVAPGSAVIAFEAPAAMRAQIEALMPEVASVSGALARPAGVAVDELGLAGGDQIDTQSTDHGYDARRGEGAWDESTMPPDDGGFTDNNTVPSAEDVGEPAEAAIVAQPMFRDPADRSPLDSDETTGGAEDDDDDVDATLQSVPIPRVVPPPPPSRTPSASRVPALLQPVAPPPVAAAPPAPRAPSDLRATPQPRPKSIPPTKPSRLPPPPPAPSAIRSPPTAQPEAPKAPRAAPSDLPLLEDDGMTVRFDTLEQFKFQYDANIRHGGIVVRSAPLPIGAQRTLGVSIVDLATRYSLGARVTFAGPGSIGFMIESFPLHRGNLEALVARAVAGR